MVSQSGITLTANTSSATYQWLDCDDAFAFIAGETSQSFTASANGTYAEEVTENNCTDTLSCYSIVSVGIDSDNNSRSFTVYPNPTTGIINIDAGNVSMDMELVIHNMLGQVVFTKQFNSGSTLAFMLEGEAGVYLITLRTSDGWNRQIKVVKE